MTLIIPTGYSQATLPFQHSASPRQAVITFGVDSSAYAGNWVVLADAILGKWGDRMGPSMDSEVTFGPVTLSVGQDGGEALAVSGTVTEVGTSVQSSVPSNVAVLVKKLSARGGRRGRGRYYIPWATSESLVNEIGIIDAGEVTSLQAASSAFLSDLLGQGSDMVLLHNTGDSAPGSPDVVTGLVVDPLVGTQRRRLGR